MAYTDASKASYAMASELLQELDEEFGSEEGYMRAAFSDLAERDTLICNHCHQKNKISSSGERVIRCHRCKKEVWCTAKTFYHKARLFRPRIVIMRLSDEGITITANQATTLLGITNHTANLVYKQLGIVVASQTPDDAIEVSTSYCTAIMTRRTKETPARESPVSEELAIQRELETQAQRYVSNGESNLSEVEEKVLGLLSESPISFDLLFERSKLAVAELSSTLVLLELQGLLESRAGNKFARTFSAAHTEADSSKDYQMFSREKSLAMSLVYFVKDYFQGIGRKYLQPYACLHWVAFDRQRWPKNSLRKLCASYPHISYQEILAYVTAPTIKIVPRYNM